MAGEEKRTQQTKEKPEKESFLKWLIIGIVLGFLTFTILPLLGL